jgi:uncharacterized protein YhfF
MNFGNFGVKKSQSRHCVAIRNDPDHIAQLVIDGVKTATCSGLIFYEIENERLPSVDDHSIILNSHDESLAIIKTGSDPINSLKW